jgi:poly(3-hydroxybutyrate) depolymerase
MNSKLGLFTVLALTTSLSHAGTLPQGSGSFDFTVPQTGKRMEVFSYQPPGADANTPVVFVLTGVNRNAAKYRDSWVENAKKNKLIVIAPLFSQTDYPGTNGYNLGNIENTKTHQVNPEGQWSFTVIGDLFANLQQQGITRQPHYYLFGNSAGCQFVHRMLTLVPEANVKAAICAAAGWWTMPDMVAPWPYGLADAPVKVTPKQQADYFAKPVLITVGDEDDDPEHPLLRRSYEAMQQGNSRLTRAQNYFLTAQKKAKRDQVDFHWRFTTLPGVGHSGSKMSAYAAEQFAWFEQHGEFKVQP